jgi:hypothetical protein
MQNPTNERGLAVVNVTDENDAELWLRVDAGCGCWMLDDSAVIWLICASVQCFARISSVSARVRRALGEDH